MNTKEAKIELKKYFEYHLEKKFQDYEDDEEHGDWYDIHASMLQRLINDPELL